MSLIKEKILLTDNDINLKITIGSGDDFFSRQQEIDKLTQITATDLVNPVSDREVRRFGFFNTVSTELQFQFYNALSGVHIATFLLAGFLPNEISNNNPKINNSFFILDFYDSFNPYEQTKIFTTYFTKITTPTSILPIYPIGTASNNQFYRWNVPISLYDNYSGDTIIGYVKFSFFNAKTGRLSLFYNNDNTALQTTEKQYFKTELNVVNKTWKIVTNSYTSTNRIIAKEYPYTINNKFVDRVNNSFEKFDNIEVLYPTGNTFNFEEGNYVIT